jgi:hypothetical protein
MDAYERTQTTGRCHVHCNVRKEEPLFQCRYKIVILRADSRMEIGERPADHLSVPLGQVFAEDRKLSGVSAPPADTEWPDASALRQVRLALPRFMLGAIPFHWAAPSPAVRPLSSPFVPPNKPQEACQSQPRRQAIRRGMDFPLGRSEWQDIGRLPYDPERS